MVTHEKYEAAPYHTYQSNFSDFSDVNANFQVALMADSYTPDLTNHEMWGDISADEIDAASMTNYSSGGKAIANNDLTRSGDTTTFAGDNVVWENSTITARYGVVYDADTGYLVSLIDFEQLEESEDGDFSIEWDSSGIFTVTANV